MQAWKEGGKETVSLGSDTTLTHSSSFSYLNINTKGKFTHNLHSSCFSMRNCKAMAASTLTGGSLSSVKHSLAESTAVARFLSSLKVMSPKLCNTQQDYKQTAHKIFRV